MYYSIMQYVTSNVPIHQWYIAIVTTESGNSIEAGELMISANITRNLVW